jgi:hypothetical protein
MKRLHALAVGMACIVSEARADFTIALIDSGSCTKPSDAVRSAIDKAAMDINNSSLAACRSR